MQNQDEAKRLSIIVDYLFGRGVSRALPKKGVTVKYSRRSGRIKLVFHDGKLFATVRPNGSMALTMYGANILAKSPRFKENYVVVRDDVAEFVKRGKSVFCKFVAKAGKNVLPRSEAVVTDTKGRVLGVGSAVINGKFMALFKSGVAVKVREGLN